MLLPVLRPHRDGSRGHSVLPNFSGREFPARNLQAAKFRTQMLDRAARIHQGPKCHVAADAGKTVKISQFHGKNRRTVGLQVGLVAPSDSSLTLSFSADSINWNPTERQVRLEVP